MILDIAHPVPLCCRAVIFLDGVRQKNCVYADDERGLIARYAEPMWADKNGRINVEWVAGLVQIVDPDAVDLHAVYTRCDRG